MPATEMDILRKIHKVVARGDQEEIETLISDISEMPKRKEKKELLESIHATILETAFHENHPELTKIPLSLPKNDIFEHILHAARLYIDTKDRAWLQAVYDLANSLDRKSSQSIILAEVTKNLIEAGVDHADPDLIEDGMEVYRRISFRKYRSAILMDIVPLHIVWSVTIRDTTLLTEDVELIEGIGDISKRSLLQSEVAKAIGRIGTATRDFDLTIRALRSAAAIKQKIRRTNCIAYIVGQTWKSSLSSQISDIMSVLERLDDLPETQIAECSAVLAEELIARSRDKSAVVVTLDSVVRTYSFALQNIITELLKAAEKTGEPYYLEAGLKFNTRLKPSEEVQIKEIVRASIAVVEQTGEAKFILQIVPIVEEAISGPKAFSIYLSLVHTMLERRAFAHALDIFKKITSFSEITQMGSQFWDTTVLLVSTGVLRDQVDDLENRVFAQMDTETKENLIQRSVTDICKNAAFNEIVRHIPSLVALCTLHRRRDEQLQTAINLLIERQFIESLDPSYLVEIARNISNPETAGAAVSQIVANIADYGVLHRNRDYLQRAVGLTCDIREQKMRSEALCSIIDRAADLAVYQGDLTLLKRMRGWTDPLLEKEYGLYTAGNIVRGMVKYGINKVAPHALENAYEIARDIDDPSLRQQLNEHITEGFIRVGCLMMAEPLTADNIDLLENRISVFRRAIEILGKTVIERRYSIRIARSIDIIEEYVADALNPYYAIPLAMFVLEIRSGAEQDAMIARVIASFEDYLDDLASTDPYEMMAFMLSRLEYARGSLEVMELTRLLLLQITNPYTRYSGMCTLVEGYLRINDTERAMDILDSIREGVKEMDIPHEKALILSDLSGLMARVDAENAYACFEKALSLLSAVNPEMGGTVRKHLVFALVSLHATKPREKNIADVDELITAIDDPIDYVNSLIAAFNMVSQGGKTTEVLQKIYTGTAAIPLPYDRASMLISVVPIAEKYGQEHDAEMLLKEADQITGEIQIPVISAMVKKGISQMFLMLAATRHDESLRVRAIDVIQSIEDELIRNRVFTQIGLSPVSPVSDQMYTRLVDAAQEVLNTPTRPDTSSLEYLLESISDRAQRAHYCFELYILFRDAGRERLADHILIIGIDEASIIRPLSKRVHILCDIALSLHEAGEKKKSRDVVGMAVNAATNIRQDDLRDGVFNDLDVVMRILQEEQV